MSGKTFLAADALQGLRVVVVGGTSGMGRATAEGAVAAGAQVISVGRRDVAQRPSHLGGLAIREEQADASDFESMCRLFAKIGPFDHLVVTAAPAPGSWGDFRDADLAGVRNYLAGKFMVAWASARAALDTIAPDGSITFVTGGAAVRPKRGLAAVVSAFAAVEALTRSLALELGPIRVNAIRPGLVDSEMWDFMQPEQRAQTMASAAATFPAGRAGTASDVASAALFLMTNGFTTGAILEVSGGETLVG